MKSIRLTRKASTSLEEILLWSIRNFGDVQTKKYKNALLLRIKALADGEPPEGRPLSRLFPVEKRLAALAFYRVEQHLIIYHNAAEILVVIDFIHIARDLVKLIEEIESINEE